MKKVDRFVRYDDAATEQSEKGIYHVTDAPYSLVDSKHKRDDREYKSKIFDPSGIIINAAVMRQGLERTEVVPPSDFRAENGPGSLPGESLLYKFKYRLLNNKNQIGVFAIDPEKKIISSEKDIDDKQAVLEEKLKALKVRHTSNV